MMPQLRNGEYVPDHRGGFVRLEGEQALLMRALFRLQCRRETFPFWPELGSRLWELRMAKPSSRRGLALAYCAQALQELPVTVRDVALEETEDGCLDMTVELSGRDQTLVGRVSV